MAKIEIFQFCIEYFATTLWVKNSVEIALSLTVSEILIYFFFFAKIQDGRQKWRKLIFFQFHIEYSATTLRVKNSVEIALSLTVSEILTFFVVVKYYSVSKRGTTAKSNPKQATDPISLHTKFGDNSSNTFPLNERKPCVTPDIGRRTAEKSKLIYPPPRVVDIIIPVSSIGLLVPTQWCIDQSKQFRKKEKVSGYGRRKPSKTLE